MALVDDEDRSGPAKPATSEDKLSELNRARQILQAEIDAHKAQIIEKTRRLNDLAEINRLPPEILSEIFFHWTNTCGRLPMGLPYHSRRWIRIAHVCHTWRQISLSTPRLWSDLTTTGLEWTREMLLRSKQAPLTIDLSTLSNHKDHQEISALVFREVQRIKSLTIHDTHYTALPKFANSVSIAPMLSSLFIAGNHQLVINGLPLSTVLENIAMPKLTRLEFNYTRFSWTTPLLQHSLTRLVFRAQSLPPFALKEQLQSTDFGRVLKILEGMPLLEYLDLSNVLPTLLATNLPQLDYYVTLSALQNLILLAAPDSCSFLLQHLNIPPSVSVDISSRVVSNEGLLNVTSAYVSKLREPRSSSTILPLRTLFYSTVQIIRLWNDVVNLDHPSNDFSIISPKPQFSLKLISGSSVRLSSALSLLPLAQIQSLVIHAPSFATNGVHTWLHLFAHMPDVCELTIQESFDDISDALGQRPPLKGKQKKGGIPLPKLKTLRLIGIRFRGYIDQDDAGTTIDKCAEMLKGRKKSRRSIERLVIKRAINFDGDDEDDLIPLVKELEWDEIEDWEDEEDSEEDSEGDYYGDLAFDAEDLHYHTADLLW